MKIPIYQVDAFADRPFQGNPAAVCLLAEPRQAAWMQAVAREMNLSETAFLLREADGYRLRWFTPSVEVDLCGHATLASAHILWEEGRLDREATARFYTRSGLLLAWRAAGPWIEMDFPGDPPAPIEVPPGLEEALGAKPVAAAAGRFDLLVEFPTANDVRSLAPDFAKLARIETLGVIATAPSDTGEADFVSRFFAPRAGVNEDPVTGSAHCCLGPFWGPRLGKRELVGYQASPRGGFVRVRLAGPRVVLGGRAVTLLRGILEA